MFQTLALRLELYEVASENSTEEIMEEVIRQCDVSLFAFPKLNNHSSILDTYPPSSDLQPRIHGL